MHEENESQTLAVSKKIENKLVEQNLRGLKTMQDALESGYILRAAQLLKNVQGVVLIGTGFPVLDTFETDGPVGAIALYQACEILGAQPIFVCCAPLSHALGRNYRVHEITVGDISTAAQNAKKTLQQYKPELIISIESPGQAIDGKYYNMRGENISERAACFDEFLKNSTCPSIAIGDGGNEIGMGNIQIALQALDIQASATQCDELVVADVSNWAALGLIAMVDYLTGRQLLDQVDAMLILKYLSEHGSVDGVTRENTLTEDGLPAQVGIELKHALQTIIK
ncbi:DUF4392 domain-containing protein [Oceaniserpentilla sp. 4NH20-0058]|uniref:glutamate cyclase domain-containing protein n=1 Tax=Oceaniserpentilla sp. 4NH20-0058 TaxID=3127660 RepID=UPI0031051510